MELQTLLNADYLDILFDNRNKKYGSYELRRNYQRRTLSALGIVTGISALLIAYGLFVNSRELDPRNIADLIGKEHQLTEVILDHPKPQPVIERIEPPVPRATVTHTVPVIVRNDEEVTQPNPTIDIGDREPGNTTTDGGENGLVTSGTIGTGHTIAPPPRIEEPVRIADEMPEFIGDLNRYLALRITYPQRAREAGIEGKVIVQFVVDERGNVTFAKVLRGIGGGCDEEALRVVNSMPGWKPGKQNGIAVKVYYTLPIRFMLE